jgi:hypothetical protein
MMFDSKVDNKKEPSESLLNDRGDRSLKKVMVSETIVFSGRIQVQGATRFNEA